MKALLATLALAASATASPSRWTPERVSTDQYESSPSFTPDGRTMIFMRANPQFSAYRLMQSTCGPQGWGEAVPLPIAAPPPASEANPFVTADGRQLWFVSNRPFPGKQGDDLDIWVADSDGRGGWGPPRRLPEPINSTQSELLPRRLPTAASSSAPTAPAAWVAMMSMWPHPRPTAAGASPIPARR